MTIQFGNTWWGKKWVDSIEHTEYENRLPRGKRYARNGSVTHIEIKEQDVHAKVQGSRRTPYNVEISLKAFDKKQKETILNIITQNPLYLSELLIRQLPEKLYDECESAAINLFPTRWNDFKANCSCPDWAPCCKHIAAIIYLIANEIDRNPFLVFSLHGMDVFLELKKLGYTADKSNTTAILSPIDLWQKPTTKKEDWKFEQAVFDQIDFSKIPHSGDRLLSLLSDNPSLPTKKDFKKTLAEAYKKFMREAKHFNRFYKDSEEKTKTELFINNKFEVDEFLHLRTLHISSADKSIGQKNSKTPIDIIYLCQEIPAKSLVFHEEKLRSLTLLTRFTLNVMEAGAFLPQLLEVEQGVEYRIRWIPALIIPEVKTIFEQIVQTAPPNFLTLDSKNKKVLSKEEQIKTLFSILFSELINDYLKYENLYKNDPISRMFFRGETLPTSSFEMQQVPQSIALWLSRLFISHKDHVPLLKVEEGRGDFLIDLYAENRKKQFQAPIPFKKILKDKKFATIRLEIMKDITLLSEHFPDIKTFVEYQGEKKLNYDYDDFIEVFFQYLPTLKLLGIPVLLPKSLEELVRPQVSVVAKKSGSSQSIKSYLSLDDMMEFSWQIALGNTKISAKEFSQLVKSQTGIIKIKDQFIYLDEKDIQKILKNLEKEPQLSHQEKMQTLLSNEYKGAAITLDAELKKLINSFLKVKKMVAPKELNARLRPYQHNGFEWLYKNSKIGFGSLIADDMGLGKTIQIITLLLQMKHEKRLEEKPALVIVPTTLLTNWTKEIEKFGPSLKVSTFYGAQRKLETNNIDVLLTTYGLIRRDIEKFQKQSWASVILDEAQNIKNTNTKQTKHIKKLKSDIRIAMTGTPVENRLTEYWSIFDFLNKGYLKGVDHFKKEFAIPIEQDRDHKTLERFKKITSPFILRRLKSDKSIITDLPDKMEVDQYCKLTKEQAGLYQNVMNQAMAAIEGADEGVMKKGLVLKLITSLKQICNHPAHFLKKKEASVDLSGKTGLLMELLDTIYENEEKVLIFTQYKEMGKLLQAMIHERFNKEPLFLHGGVSRKKRDEMVDQFQNQTYVKTMLLSLKAGGTGLNLTAAQNVIHFDLWWNPAVEAQATDRAYRIGQKNNVMVHRLITQSTFEEKIDKMIKDKKELADLAVSKGEKWIGDFSNTELRELFSLEGN